MVDRKREHATLSIPAAPVLSHWLAISVYEEADN